MEEIETINPFAYLPSSFKQQYDQQSLIQQGGDQSLSSLSSLAVGFGNVAMYADQTGLRLGNVKTSSAPFGVDMNGNVHATTLQISGNQIVSGIINGSTVNITNLNASNIVTGTLSANFLNGGTIDANNISVIHLNASNITTGTLSANFINGGTLVLGGNNNGNGVLSLVDGSNNEILRMNSSGIIIRNNQSLFAQSTGGQQDFFKFYNNGSSQGIIQLPNTNQFIMLSSDGLTNYFTVSSSKIFCNYALWVNSDFHFGDGNNDQRHDFHGVGQLNAISGDLVLDATSGGHKVRINSPLDGNQNDLDNVHDIFCHNVNGNNSNFSGSKSAILPTSDGWRKVYSAEAPDAWFFDFAPTLEEIDPKFLEITEGDMRTVTTDQGDVLVFRKRKFTDYFKGRRFAKINKAVVS